MSLRRFASSSSMAAADATSPAISGASPVPGSSGRQGKGKVTWYAYYDASSRLPYYYQPESGETVWELPTGNATIIPMTPSVTRQIAVSGNTSGMGTKKRSTVLMPSPAVLSSARNYLRGDKV
ncbi:hypothetical protein EON66_11175 [archaeon]|nr:MAG: hypothetical protein EON66_11175 [archaeon]